MRRRAFLRSTGGLATIGTTVIAGCGGDGNDDDPTPGPNTVNMVTERGSYYFDPIGLAVESGETVTFRLDSGRHSATAYTNENIDSRRIPEGAESWNSTTLSTEGATFEHTFEVEGTYDYFCIPHRTLAMIGRIVVGSPGGPAEGSENPDADLPDGDTIVEQGSVSYDEFSG